VATARGLDPAVVTQLVQENTHVRVLRFLGMPRVNVLELNFAVSRL